MQRTTNKGELYVFRARCDSVMLIDQHGRGSHGVRKSSYDKSDPSPNQLVPYGSDHTDTPADNVTLIRRRRRHRSLGPSHSLVAKRDLFPSSPSAKRHERGTKQTSDTRGPLVRQRRASSPETYQSLRSKQGLPPRSDLNPPKEMNKYLAERDSDKPQCPLIVHQADDIHYQATEYFRRTGRAMPLSDEQRRIVEQAPKAKKRYYKGVGSHLVSVGLMAAGDSSSEEEFGSGSEEARDSAQRQRRRRSKRHEGSRRRPEW